MLAGVVATLCSAHNRIRQAADPGKAILSVLALPPQSGRTRDGQIRAIAISLSKALKYSSTGTGPMSEEATRRMCQNLALQTQRQWRKARSLPHHGKTQPLGCFAESELVLDDGMLRAASGTFGCDPSSRCSAAQYLYESPDQLKALIDLLRPSEENEEISGKRENSKRRAALKMLLKEGPTKFNKRNCRALGDAYFAMMCPPGSHVITTNLVDHIPLCKELGKVALNPVRYS